MKPEEKVQAGVFTIEKCHGGLAIRKANPLSTAGSDIVGRVYHVGLKTVNDSNGRQTEVEVPMPQDEWRVDLCGETAYGDLAKIMELLKSYKAE